MAQPRAAWQRDTVAGLRAIATRVRAIIETIDVEALAEKVTEEPARLPPLANALAKLTDAAIKYERHRAEQEAERRKARGAQGRQEGGLSDEALARIEDELNLF